MTLVHELPEFKLGVTHELVPDALYKYGADLRKYPAPNGIRFKETKSGSLQVFVVGNDGSAEFPPGTWKKL